MIKTRLLLVSVLVMSLALVLTWAMAHGSELGILPSSDSPTTTRPMPTATAIWQGLQENPKGQRQTVLLWPKELAEFMSEYPSWEMWLGGGRTSPYSLRDELLVSVRALATIIPDLTVGTDEPNSDIIIVRGTPAALGALLDQLRDHPLMARVTEDAPARRDEARAAWAKSRLGTDYGIPWRSPARAVNIRNNWVTNVVWGYSTPGATVWVTLTRNTGHILTTTTIADLDGLYHAFLIWEIRDGDVIEVNDDTEVETVSIIPLRVSGEASTASVTGIVPLDSEAARKTPGQILEMTVGKASRGVTVGSGGAFAADFSDESFLPGTPGFLRYKDMDGNRIFQPFRASIVNVRRDTSNGFPADAHSEGISSIVWGSASPSTALAITLTRPGTFVITRTVATDQVGSFSVSVDRLIEDGDVVQVSDGTSVRPVQVPTMTVWADPVTKIITGVAPAGITTTISEAPHSLAVSIAGGTRQVTTTVTGIFSADLSTRPYLAGLLGSLLYTTRSGDRVYKPVFVADPLSRGKLGDWRADTILGQPNFSQITPNEVVGNKIFNPGGVYVDRSIQPNRVYVYDSGNNRVLGLSHLGVCLAGAHAGQNCTSDSDCPGSICQIQETRPADIVLGQPSSNTSACNGDSSYQRYPEAPMANAETLCGLPEASVSILEGGSGTTMAVDPEGNLYVPDVFNNRVLRYNSPFTTDTIADYAWGQADLNGMMCNRSSGFGHPDRTGLCLSGFAGVALDAVGNLWVADILNNRVLRFPYSLTLDMPAQEADLVLGQPDFTTVASGITLNRMNQPASVRVNNSGVVYVADSLNNRVLAFAPPFANGMSASRVVGSNFHRPLGLEIDSGNGLWVVDTDSYRLIRYVNETQSEVIAVDGVQGGVGVDRDNNIVSAPSGGIQGGMRFSAPTYTAYTRFLRSVPDGISNQIGPHGFQAGLGLEVAAGQLIRTDWTRLLFWNNPWKLANGQAADGVVGETDFQTHSGGHNFGRMRADKMGRLWVIAGSWPQTGVYGFQLPLKTGATPVYTVTSPLPLQGGGIFTWTNGLVAGGIDIQPSCDCLWLSDADNHRVFRIKNVSTQPIVDIVIGQKDSSGIHCNHGRDPDNGPYMFPTRDSLCHPGGLAFDRNGNLFIADHNLEVAGNLRLLEFDSSTLPDAPVLAVFGISATRVFGRNGDFTAPNCLHWIQDPMCGPWEPTFDSRGRMVVGLNGYVDPRFPLVYQNPLTNPLPIAVVGDFHSMPLSSRFDQFDNLYVIDHNRNRVLIYRDRPVQTFSVNGTVKVPNAAPVPGVQVETVGYASSGLTDPRGVYTLTGLVTGTYVLTPSKEYYAFTPATRTISVPGATSGHDFIATIPLTGVAISGPTSGAIQVSYTFTATVGPIIAMLPVTYTWQATRQSPVMHAGGLSDTVTFTWDTAGTHAITVTAVNAGGIVTGRYTVSIGVSLLGFAPSANIHTAPLTTTICITYNQAISASTANVNTIAIHAMQAGLLIPAFSVNGGAICMSPTRSFKPGEWVQASATTGTLSLAGRRPLGPTVWQFRTKSSRAQGVFAPKVDYATGSGPWAVATGDIDNDGDLDALVVNNHSNTMSVRKNNGDGVFAPKVDYITLAYPWSIALGDVDNDGDLDALVGYYGASAISAFKNNGDGTFAAKVDYATGPSPYPIALGDVDGDGYLDVLVGNYNSDTLSVLKNNKDGTFAAKVDYVTGATPEGLTVGDVDGDGDLDVLGANWNSATLSVLKNNGDGTFAAKVDYAAGSGAVKVAVGDVDGDGDLDAVVANDTAGSLSVFKNSGYGTFPVRTNYAIGFNPEYVTLADMDGDGDLDVLVANKSASSLSEFKNIGDGTFVAKVDYETGATPSSVAVGDVDGDGDLDALVVNRDSNTLSVLLNRDIVYTKTYLPLVLRAP